MNNLNYELRQLCHRCREGSANTQRDRIKILTLCANDLKSLGFKHMKLTSLKPKHVEALLNKWNREELSQGTLKNRMAHLRWWAQKINRAGIIAKDNAALGIVQRSYVTTENKAKTLDAEKLKSITHPHIKMSLKLQAAFGLRRQESIKFNPDYADKGDYIQLKGSWTKGGKPRTVPVRTETQRALLNEVHAFAGKASLIPANKSYVEQLRVYEGQCKKAGFTKMHGLRHQYAQSRYEELTGWRSPKAGGPKQNTLRPEQKIIDKEARETISRELGHERLEIVKVYIG